VTAFEVKPLAKRVVHHVGLLALSSTELEMMRRQDEADPASGFACMDGPSRVILAWNAGPFVYRLPEGTGIRLRRGFTYLLQIHYATDEGSEPDRTRVDLQLTDQIPQVAALGSFSQIENLNLQPGQERVEYVVETPISTPLKVLAFSPHMHAFGRTMRIELERAGQRSCLMNTTRYDYHMQEFYFLEEPVSLQRNDRVFVTCGFDTRRATAPVTSDDWGRNSEMCGAFAYIVAP
jgi:hypothetical protein